MKNICYTLLFKVLRGLLAGVIGWAVTKGYATSGQAEYVVTAALGTACWAASTFMSAVTHNLKIRLALETAPDKDFSLAELRAAMWSAVVDTLKSYFRKFLNRKDQ